MTETQFFGLILNVLAILATGAGAVIFVHRQMEAASKKWADYFAKLEEKGDRRTELLEKKFDEHTSRVEQRWERIAETFDKTYVRIHVCDLMHGNLARRVEALEGKE